MHVHVQVFVWTYTFVSCGYISRGGTAEMYNRYVFDFIQEIAELFHKVILPYYMYHLHAMKVPVTLHLCQFLTQSIFLI